MTVNMTRRKNFEQFQSDLFEVTASRDFKGMIRRKLTYPGALHFRDYRELWIFMVNDMNNLQNISLAVHIQVEPPEGMGTKGRLRLAGHDQLELKVAASPTSPTYGDWNGATPCVPDSFEYQERLIVEDIIEDIWRELARTGTSVFGASDMDAWE